jgi:hypothetical protein
MRTRTLPASQHPEAATIVEVIDDRGDGLGEVLVATWGVTDDLMVPAGVDLLCEAADMMGLSGTSLLLRLAAMLDGADLETLALLAVEVAELARVEVR